MREKWMGAHVLTINQGGEHSAQAECTKRHSSTRRDIFSPSRESKHDVTQLVEHGKELRIPGCQ